MSILLLICIFIFTFSPFKANAQTNENYDYYLKKVGFCDVGVGYDVHVDEDYAYVSNNDGLMVIDVSDPQNPEKVGELLIDDGAFGFFLEENIAYIAADSSGFVIADFSDPLHPEILGQDSEGPAYKIAVSGSVAYVSYMGSGFKVFDVNDPSDPIPISEFSDIRSDDIQVKEHIVYFANADVGLKVIDVSDPSSPQLIKIVPQTGGVTDIYNDNNLLFLACWGNGIKILDISNPTSPLTVVLDSYVDNDGGEELGLIEREGLLYVSDNYGIELFNVSDPTSIVKIAENRDSISAAHDIDVDNEYIYVALGGGLLILEVSTESEEGIPSFSFWIIPVLIITIAGISSRMYFKISRPKRG